MELQFRCPSCDKLLQVPDRLAGKKVRCTKCEKIVTAPDEGEGKYAVTSRAGAKPPPSDPDDREEPRSRSRTSSRSRSERDFRDRPARRKSGSGLWVAIGAGGIGAVALAIGVIFALTREEAPPQPLPKPKPVVEEAKAAEPPPQPIVNPPVVGPGDGPVVIMTPQGPVVGGGLGMPAELDNVNLQRVKRSTVYLRVTTANGQIGEGTGFLALEPGLVITNAHVVGMRTPSAPLPRNVQVIINSGENGERSYTGTVLGAESGLDLAVVRIEAGGAPLPPMLKLDSALNLTELQKVYIFGFPFGAQLGKNITVSESSVSSLRKLPGGGIAQVQVNGGMHPGNSGGPVVNARGDVVGISVAVIKGTQINFAVPSDHVLPLIQGFVRETVAGAAYRSGTTVKLPVKVHCTDPLKRISELHMEVWSGAQGEIRPASLLKPNAQPGDGPKQMLALTYRNGGADAEIDVPEVPVGGAVWVRPIITGQNGVKMWAAAIPIQVNDEAPLERVPAVFRLSNAKIPERTVTLESTRLIRLIKGNEQFVFGERIEFSVLEHMQPEPRGISVALHPGSIRVKREIQGQGLWASSPGAQLVQRLLFTFLMAPDGALKERGHPGQLQSLPPVLKGDAESVFNNVANCYEATSLSIPQQSVEPLKAWTTRLPLLLTTDGKNEVADMNLTCTYEGTRKDEDRQLAFVRLDGDVRGRGTKADAGGRVTGHALFDLTGGFIARAKIVVDSELGSGLILAHNTFEIQLTRQAGNAMNIAKVDPKAKLPTKLEDIKPDPVAKIAKGKELLNVKEELTPADPLDKRKPSGRYKEYKIKLTAGVKYVIEMNTPDSKRLDPFLRLETSRGDVVAFDDDGGGDMNARIVYNPDRTDEFRIIATVFEPNQTGPFTLIVSEAAKEAAPAKTEKK